MEVKSRPLLPGGAGSNSVLLFLIIAEWNGVPSSELKLFIACLNGIACQSERNRS